jgi:hypothetical protein
MKAKDERVLARTSDEREKTFRQWRVGIETRAVS